MKKNSIRVLFTFLAVFLWAGFSQAQTLDYPHSVTNGVDCVDCHYTGATDFLDPSWKHDPQSNIDDTPFNNFCWSCHNGTTALKVDTHSSFSTGSRFGNWNIECRTCHWPHHLMQYRTYGSESIIETGQSTAVTTTSLTKDGAGWADDEFKGLILIPDLSVDNYNYKITGNTPDTLNVSGNMDLNHVSAGNLFAIVYEKLVKSTITTPHSGDRTVKFFNSAGSNSFADDGAAPFDGVCEVCHTQTNHFRNDGTGSDPLHENMAYPAGTDCTRCHMHKNGFRGMGGGAHDTHVNEEYGPRITCVSGNLGCHGSSPIPLMADGQNLANTTVCDGCHSADGAAIAKQYWNKSGSSLSNPDSWRGIAGEKSYCGSCHDETPGIINSKSAPNIAGDKATYGFFDTGHGRTGSNYPRLSWQDSSALGNPPAGRSCGDCHDLTSIHIGDGDTSRLKPGFENDDDNSNCVQCHTASGNPVTANSAPLFYSDYQDYQNSAHAVVKCSDCHDVHGVSHGTGGGYTAMTRSDRQSLCYQCHKDPSSGGIVNDALANNRPGGYVSANDIQEAFSKSKTHSLGTSFTVADRDYTLECVSCHNVHIITGKYWDAKQGKSPVTRFPGNADGFPVTEIWGDGSGEKMDDFAARGSGTGGFYFNIARGYNLGATGMPFDQPAVYQPPKSGSDYNFEFAGNVLPDYTTFCLDCHTNRVSDAVPPINWGQGIACTDNSVDPPNQRVECGAQHGLGVAGLPYYITDAGTAGVWGDSGNPDVLFDMNYVTRGRHNGHFMRWPYDSAERSAGINFVLSCTDCHEAHGSNRGGMIRERFSVNDSGACGTGSSNGENCTDGGNWNSFCNVCHYYYGGHHANMSCGNASCHEANSIHRIIHVTHSGGTQLMLTAAGYESSYQRPDFTPDIVSVEGHIGSNVLTVTFASGVWSNMDFSLALDPGDFWLFDKNGNNPRTITNVAHTAGESIATLTMSAPLSADDLNTDTLAVRPASIWNWYNGGYVNWATGTIPAQPVSAGPWPVTITGPPLFGITKVFYAGDQIQVIFTEGAYTNMAATGDLTMSDFTLNNCGGRTITNVNHTAGDDRATLTLSSALSQSEVGICEVSAVSNEIFDYLGNNALTGPVTLSFSDECPSGAAIFQLNEAAGSPRAFSEQYWLVGTVNNPGVTLPGDGLLHGDGSTANYIDFENNDICLQASTEMTIETRIKPAGIGSANYVRRILARDGGSNYQISVWRNNTDATNFPNYSAPAGTASIALWVRVADQHGGDAWKVVLTDYTSCPIQSDHWYQVKVVWNTNKPGGTPGQFFVPADIYVDDQGTNGSGAGEIWSGYANCTRSDQGYGADRKKLYTGDEILQADSDFVIGANINNHNNNLFNGLIDWIIWKPYAE